MALYARQVSPSEQSSPFWDGDEMWDGIILYKPIRKYSADPKYKAFLKSCRTILTYFRISRITGVSSTIPLRIT